MAPSPIAIRGEEVCTPVGKQPSVVPRQLRDGSSRRSGPCGGPLERRARLLLEALAAVVEETPLMGLRLSPLNSFNDMADSDPVGLIPWLAERLNELPLAYLHLMRGDFLGRQQGDVLTPAREHFHGVLVADMGDVRCPHSVPSAWLRGQTGALHLAAASPPSMPPPPHPSQDGPMPPPPPPATGASSTPSPSASA